MTHTALLKEILEKAHCVRKEFHGEYLSAAHIVVAVADFCSTKYTGFSVSDMTWWPNRFEEERLRYAFSKEAKLKSYFRLRLSRNAKAGVQEAAFDVTDCEHLAALSNAEMLSSDVVFLWALANLHEAYKPAVRSVISEASALAFLQEIDANIFDYVIQQIEGICSDLKKKADEAVKIRDWKPAAKFAEPEALIQLAFANIETKHTDHITTIKIPKFFGSATLTLSIHCVDGLYYIHDNRCALKYLARTIRDTKKYERAIKKVCHSHRIDNGRITGSFANITGFMYYLKELVFAAQAALYYPKATRQLCRKDTGYAYMPESKGEPFDEAVLIDMLKTGIDTYYDENEGLSCWLKAGNSPFQTRYSFLVETLDNGCIRFSDKRKGSYEGELLEPCYWYHESNDISVYSNFITKLAGHFGGEFDGQNVYLTEKSNDFQSALFRFFQLAVLISRFGHDIALPKGR